jgi:hypothetical protein
LENEHKLEHYYKHAEDRGRKQGKKLLNKLTFRPTTNPMPINTPTISVARPRPSNEREGVPARGEVGPYAEVVGVFGRRGWWLVIDDGEG